MSNVRVVDSKVESVMLQGGRITSLLERGETTSGHRQLMQISISTMLGKHLH